MAKVRCCVIALYSCLFGVFWAGQVAQSAAPEASEKDNISALDSSDNSQKNTPIDEKASNRYTREVKADFQDVFADLEFAITEKNYRITGVNSIGRAITDRSDSPFPLASVVHFCNIEAAKEILEISMDYLLLMPCRVTLNEIEDGYVLIEAQLLPLDDEKLRNTAINVNELLREIVDFAAGDW